MEIPVYDEQVGKVRRMEAGRALRWLGESMGYDNKHFIGFRETAATAIVAAAARLGRDPIQLAEELADGSIADLINGTEPERSRIARAASQVDHTIEDVLRWAEAEERRVANRLRKVLKELQELRAEIQLNERCERYWYHEWDRFQKEGEST